MDISLGQHVASFKASRDLSRDKEAFLERCKKKYQTVKLAGLDMVGLGGSCGKPAFLLPFTLRFNLKKLEALEALAENFDMYVEYGAYAHLKSKDGDREIAAIQDWINCTVVFMRPSFDTREELLNALSESLQ